MTNEICIGQVYSSELNSIVVRATNLKIIETAKNNLSLGNLLKISDGNLNYTIAIIQNFKIVDDKDNESSECKIDIFCQPIGTISNDRFQRGLKTLPLPTESAYIVDETLLKEIFENNEEYNFVAGNLAQNKNIKAMLNGNKLFSKHISVVGSTGAGKSCVVSKLLQEAVGIENCQNKNKESQKNSHIIIFDIHSEYKNAFTLVEQEKFNINMLDVNSLKLPYWLMNSEELEDIFIESNEANSHNQISQFKQAVILNKKKYNSEHYKDINYDSPLYFDIKEVYHYICNLNREVIGKTANDNNLPKLSNGNLINFREDYYFDEILDFAETSTAKDTKASIGPFNGEFNRFCSRLETKLSDDRLSFLLKAQKEDSSSYKSKDFEEILKQFLGYINKSNITIIDLSGIPFEVLSITISLISRLIFDFAFNYSKIKHQVGYLNDIPIMLVCEEAHNYIPKSNEALYKASKKSIERIAKEGRKYGLSLMVVSQRPSEVSETIMAQCNNFIALRLTNSNDQSYVKNLLPDSIGSICESLPSLEPGEALIVGDSTLIPSIVQFELPNPLPKSETVEFLSEWQNNWKDVCFVDIIKRWRKETI
ncbi:ATP-binding protein [bacterium]|nr:ATP-binding protein [bacterium]